MIYGTESRKTQYPHSKSEQNFTSRPEYLDLHQVVVEKILVHQVRYPSTSLSFREIKAKFYADTLLRLCKSSYFFSIFINTNHSRASLSQSSAMDDRHVLYQPKMLCLPVTNIFSSRSDRLFKSPQWSGQIFAVGETERYWGRSQ